jgi:hypothetical protein
MSSEGKNNLKKITLHYYDYFLLMPRQKNRHRKTTRSCEPQVYYTHVQLEQCEKVFTKMKY